MLLLIPLVAMQFTSEVSWTLGDFVVAGVLLLMAGYLFALLIQRAKSQAAMLFIGLVLLTGLLVVWVELAVGIF